KSSRTSPRKRCARTGDGRQRLNIGRKLMNIHRRTLLALAVATGLTAPSWAIAQDDTIRIGLLATFEGPFTVLGEDGERGAMTAVDEFGGTVAGKKIEIVKGSSDASPDSAVRAARKLVEQ